ncbi:hypothetical protein LINGRAHAP2_LOCUS24614 [Linum grandiflorum]
MGYNSLGLWVFDGYGFNPTQWRPLLLAKESELDHQHASLLLLQYKEFCSRQWEVHLFHIYRKANNAVNYLANLGHSLTYRMHLLDSPYWSLSN